VKKKIRRVLGSMAMIHGLVLLGLFALWGYIETGAAYILLGMAASFAGAVCGGFVRVIDTIKQK
jgi:uncharacterized membrane protein